MQKWEYLELMFYSRWSGNTLHITRVSVNGKAISDSQISAHIYQEPDKIEQYKAHLLNQIGKDGWELVSVAGEALGSNRTYVFKRPRQEQ